MARKGRVRLRRLGDFVAQTYPEFEDPDRTIRARRVSVDGWVVDNPASLVRPDATIRVVREAKLRGEAKLTAAFERFDVAVSGRVALDLGAAAGGFTRVLLRCGVVKVFAVDAGFGQLLGSLRQDPRVINLERTNVADLDRRLVSDEIELLTADLSYLPLARAIAQLNEHIRIAADADLVALVKPQFELGRATPPTTAFELAAAVGRATAGVVRAGWTVRGTTESPVSGSRGAIEFFLHAVRTKR